MSMTAIKTETLSDIRLEKRGSESREVVALCPQCKAMQTIWINSGGLMPTRKFFQRGETIFHDCGSILPCRLYASW